MAREGNELRQFFDQIPAVTKVLVVGSVLPYLLDRFKIVSADHFYNYGFRDTFRTLELWKPVTSFFVVLGHPIWNVALHAYMLYQHSSWLELHHFRHRGDYVFFLVFVGTVISILQAFLPMTRASGALSIALLYTWVQENLDKSVSVYFVSLPAIYLPPAMLLVTFLLEGVTGLLLELTGLLAAHLFLYLDTLYPLCGGRRLISTPRIFYRWFSEPIPAPGATTRAGPASGFSVRPPPNTSGLNSASSATTSGRSSFQGAGRRLGK